MSKSQAPNHRGAPRPRKPARPSEAEEIVRALKNAEIDALIATGPEGERLYLLEEADQAFRALMDAIDQGALTLLPDGTVFFCNQAFAEMLGLSAPQITGENMQQFIPVSDQPHWARLLALALKGSSGGEIRLHGGRHELVSARISFLPVQPSGDGAVPAHSINAILTPIGESTLSEDQIRLMSERLEERVRARTAELEGANRGLLKEIAKRKRVEAALRLSEERFRIALMSSPITVFNQDRDLRYTWVYNPTSGFSVESIVGKTDAEVFPDAAEHLTGIKRRILETGEGRRQEIVVAIDNQSRYYDLTIEPLRDQTGEIVGVTCVSVDNTERKLAEQALRESEERYRLITENSRDLISMMDLQGNFVYASPSFETILEYDSEQLLTMNALELVHPDDLARLENWQNAQQFEFRMRKTGGSWVWLEGSSYQVTRNGVAYVVGIARVISDRKQAEESVRQSQAQLRQWISELELRNKEITLLSEMVNLFQACRTPREAYAVIAQYTQRLFPEEAGALYVLNASRNMLENVASWGEPPPPEHYFEPTACWALRRGRVYVVQDEESPMICGHMRGQASPGYMCVPMVAQGETLGILTLHARTDRVGEIGPIEEGKQQLATTVAEHIALALANLRLREELRLQAIRDPLTNLYNRRYMEETLERELYRAKREASSLGVIMLDIDHFKDFNDSYGHEAGDLILREVGRFLEMRIRKEDIACRYGGEEFTLILPEDTLEKAHQRAEELRQGIQALAVRYEGESLGVITLSCGVAAYPEHAITVEGLLRAADMALYRAKAQGRDRVVVA